MDSDNEGLKGESPDSQMSSDMALIDAFADGNGRETVLVLGLGFVGSAMTAALSMARNGEGKPLYNVIGVDRSDEPNRWKLDAVNGGRSPVESADERLNQAFADGLGNGNVLATSSEYAYCKARVVVVDLNLDVTREQRGSARDYSFSYDMYKDALSVVAGNIKDESLVIIETTVPPGTTENVVYPLFKEIFTERGLDSDKINLAFCYERVMPGPEYLNSVINYYRVYSGISDHSKELTRGFLESFINTADYPLREMETPRAAEAAKILENSFRAVNIAFVQEWTSLAHQIGIDLFEVVDAIRVRSTHRNLMYPGFGVGGYCLPKDTLLADYSINNLFDGDTELRMSLDALGVNDLMPEFAFKLLLRKLPNLNGAHVTLLGVSYRNDVADTRNSPSELFYDLCVDQGAKVRLYDELAAYWSEKNLEIETSLKTFREVQHDVVVFAVNQSSLSSLTAQDIISIFSGVKIVIDANNVIADDTGKALFEAGISVAGVGKGHWDQWG
jgi:UDP-N-acetyl-D-glucosamine dehydrogenase